MLIRVNFYDKNKRRVDKGYLIAVNNKHGYIQHDKDILRVKLKNIKIIDNKRKL